MGRRCSRSCCRSRVKPCSGLKPTRRLNAELRAAPFAAKIAWDALERRQAKLHATVCGSLAIGDEPPPVLDEDCRRYLALLGPVQIELRGLFSGNINVGRLYLRRLPGAPRGRERLAQIQRTLGRRETDLYVVGVWSLTDDLDAAEADALSRIIEWWWDRPILRFQSDHVWLLCAMDDLVLDSMIIEVIPLTPTCDWHDTHRGSNFGVLVHMRRVVVREHHAGLQSLRSMRRIEARRRKASALQLRFSQSLASRRQRFSQAMVRSTIQRFGRTTNPFA